MRRPFDNHFPLTQSFGVNPANYSKFNLKGHNGLDFGLPTNTPVLAPHSGKIIEAAFDEKGYGNYLKIENEKEGSVLAHLKDFLVGVGYTVLEGQPIGHSDNTGNSTGPHLHWGYYLFPRNRQNGFAGFIDQSRYLLPSPTSFKFYPATRNVIVTAAANIRITPQVGDDLVNIEDEAVEKQTLSVDGFVEGDLIQNNNLWWKLRDKDQFIWSGVTNVIPTIPKEVPVPVNAEPATGKSRLELEVENQQLKEDMDRVIKNAADINTQNTVLKEDLLAKTQRVAQLEATMSGDDLLKSANEDLSATNKELITHNKLLAAERDNAFVEAFKGWQLFELKKETNLFSGLVKLVTTLSVIKYTFEKEGAVVGYKIGAKLYKVGEEKVTDSPTVEKPQSSS